MLGDESGLEVWWNFFRSRKETHGGVEDLCFRQVLVRGLRLSVRRRTEKDLGLVVLWTVGHKNPVFEDLVVSRFYYVLFR